MSPRLAARLAAASLGLGLVACGNLPPGEPRRVEQAPTDVARPLREFRPGEVPTFKLPAKGKRLGRVKLPPSSGSVPGTHTMALDVSRWLTKAQSRYFTDKCKPGMGEEVDKGGFVVGWEQWEINGDPCVSSVTQVAVLFDDAQLGKILNKIVDKAVLTYDEVPARFCTKGYCWLNGDGIPEPKPNGCVEVRIPSVNWTRAEPQGMVPYSTSRPAVRRLGPREWDVTEAFNWQHTPGAAPLGASPGHGFLLSGGPSVDQLDAEDNASCGSVISNIKLHVTYTVFKDEPFRAPR